MKPQIALETILFQYKYLPFIGGWLLTGHVKIPENDQTKRNELFHTYVPNKGNIKDLGLAGKGNFLLDVQYFKQLRSFTGYTEVRLYCKRDRIIDTVITVDDQIYKFMTGEESNFDYCSKTLRFLKDDTSLLSKQPCGVLRGSHHYPGNGVYGSLLYVGSQYHVLLVAGRMECDDFDLVNLGEWKYYLR